ncbi:MAG: prepilin-type N-terminal cleavage/methylation domain-containing protein [Nitrospiraceae bacterium]|nr:prepilin-type N-terminal cleavage/methylation domain-containing protein [Nitrospiraceae bacterium]MDA8089893.1 prepilin-type N-terminal cleavage/methylation domain-containing protein [Nitrospiraceae bacterium]
MSFFFFFFKRPPDKKRKDGGFTLIEVLLATALTVVVLAAVYGTFFLVEKAREGANGSLVRMYEAQKIMDVLRREIEAMNGPVTLVDKEYFGKRGASLSFSAFSPKNGVLSKISYFAQEGDKKDKDTIDLIKELQAPGGAIENAPLIENIEEFSVQIYSGGKWVRTLQASSPPGDVHVTLKILFKGTPLIMEETVTPRIGKQL